MSSSITVFIDEAGDPGIRDGLRYVSSRHEWFCIAALVIKSSRLLALEEWVRDLRIIANARQSRALHYHRVTKDRRANVCKLLATKPCRAFVIASHKSNMRAYINERLKTSVDAGTFYNWCLRLLLERVTSWSADWLRRQQTSLEPLRVTLARRGHDYDHLFSYVDLLRMQKMTGTLVLKGPGLAPELLDSTHWTVERAEEVAGLQLADIIASSFYQAANSASPSWDIEPAKALAPIMARRWTSSANFGVTLFPRPHQAVIPEKARLLFGAYGYSF